MRRRLNSLSCAKSISITAALRPVQCKEGSYVTMWMSSSRLGSAVCLRLFSIQVPRRTVLLRGWTEWTMTPFTGKLSDRKLVQYVLFLCHWNKRLWYFVFFFLFAIVGSWQIFTPHPTQPPHHHVHFTVNVASLDFSETAEGFFFLLPQLWWRATWNRLRNCDGSK